MRHRTVHRSKADQMGAVSQMLSNFARNFAQQHANFCGGVPTQTAYFDQAR
jgi:hypothetical protein